MKIKLLCFNKIANEMNEAYIYFFQKIKKIADFQIVEIAEINSGNIKANRVKNEEILIKKIEEFKDYQFFLLEINAKQYTSEQFAALIENNKDFKGAKIAFIIGPSDGFSDDFRKQFEYKISFGLMTFPYSLIRLILVEQIYRAFKIIRNEPYHK